MARKGQSRKRPQEKHQRSGQQLFHDEILTLSCVRVSSSRRNGYAWSSSQDAQASFRRRGKDFPMIKTFTLAAALIGGALLAAPASAAPIGSASGPSLALATGGNDLVETVQYRRYGYGPRYGYRGGYYRGGRGAAVGAGIAAGVIGGALAAGALAGPRYVEPAPIYGVPAPVYGYGAEDVDAVAYCSRRFRTYDPATGTYIATGGVVRACP
jgi:hypothetical protein